MKLSLFLILPLLAVAFASEDFDEAIEEDLSLSEDEGERELYHLGRQPYYYTPYYTTSNYHGRTSNYRGGSKCRKRKKRCCNCVDSCSSSSSDWSSSEEKKCIRKECKDKCKKAADKCYGSKKKWKVSARCLQNDGERYTSDLSYLSFYRDILISR